MKDAEVTDADGAAGASAKLSHTVEVDRYGEYEVTFSPAAEKPDDRYRDTSASVRATSRPPRYRRGSTSTAGTPPGPAQR